MKRFAALYVIPFLSILIILIKVPEIDKFLRATFHEKAPLYIVFTSAICTLLIHIFTIISPFKKYEKLAKNKWGLINSITDNYLGQELFPSHTLTLNVMQTKRVFFSTLTPNAKTDFTGKLKYFFNCFFVKEFFLVWKPENHHIHKKLKLTCSQGVSGAAYTTGKVAIVDITTNIDNLGLNDRQKNIISGRGFVISCPIFAFDKEYINLLSSKIIGVVNISCSTLGAEKLIQEEKNREILTQKAVSFSRICSLIL